jgi:hypothetical protein
VAVLDAATNSVLTTLRGVYGNVTTLTTLKPSLPSLAANITSMTGDISLGASAGTLIANLNSAQALLNALPLASLDDARTSLDSLK